MSSMCDGEACWAEGWLQHSVTISNASSDAVQLLALGLEGPLISDASPDSFPTRHVPFPVHVIAPLFLLMAAVLLHELYALYRKPILADHVHSSNNWVQAAFLVSKIQLGINVTVTVPISLDFCLQMGQSATMSGFYLAAPLVGGVVGLLVAKALTEETHWNQPFVRRLLVLCPNLATLCILANAYLLNTAAERSMGDRTKTFWISLLLVQAQIALTSIPQLPMSVMQNKMTPNSEKTFWMIMNQSFGNVGTLAGPGIFGVLAYAVKAGQEVSPASLLAWVNVTLGIILVLGANYNSWVLPCVLVPLHEEDAPVVPAEETCVSMLPVDQREKVVKNMVWYVIERTFSLSTTQIGALTLLEVSYDWPNELSATVFTAVSSSSLICSLMSSIVLESGWVTESSVFFGTNGLGLVGTLFLFGFGRGPGGLLLAVGLIYGMTTVCLGLADGWALQAAVEGTDFSVELYRFQTGFSVCPCFLAPVFVRAIMDFGGRNTYAGIQFFLVLISTWTMYKTVKMVWDEDFQAEVEAFGLSPKSDLVVSPKRREKRRKSI